MDLLEFTSRYVDVYKRHQSASYYDSVDIISNRSVSARFGVAKFKDWEFDRPVISVFLKGGHVYMMLDDGSIYEYNNCLDFDPKKLSSLPTDIVDMIEIEDDVNVLFVGNDGTLYDEYGTVVEDIWHRVEYLWG